MYRPRLKAEAWDRAEGTKHFSTASYHSSSNFNIPPISFYSPQSWPTSLPTLTVSEEETTAVGMRNAPFKTSLGFFRTSISRRTAAHVRSLQRDSSVMSFVPAVHLMAEKCNSAPTKCLFAAQTGSTGVTFYTERTH